MLDALPAGVLHLNHRLTGLKEAEGRVQLEFENRSPTEADVVIGADGINSSVRETLWGKEPIRHQGLHLVGGWLYVDGPMPLEGVVAHNRITQASYTPIRHEGRNGYEWWILEACEPGATFTEDLLSYARRRAADFSDTLRSLIDRTPPENLQRWEIRDRPPLKQWSKGRVTLAGDAAHPTSPYAAYGAGMSIEDGYFLARELDACDIRDDDSVRRALQRYEDRRKPHTSRVSQQAYFTGKLFHRTPRLLQPVRDFVFDHTSLLQKIVGDATPAHILAQLEEITDSDSHPTPAPRRTFATS
jgi:6-hydroxynicotinate 3-monooxygenase